MKQQQLAVCFALMACVAMAHDMTKTEGKVQASPNIFSWGLDLFRLFVLWPIPYFLFILPVGWVIALLGWPDSYATMISGLVNDTIALTVGI
jgi:hypothetical protein